MSYFTEDMVAVVEQCGEEVADALVKHCAGLQLYIPATKTTLKGPLANLSEAHVAALQAQFGGTSIYVPTGRRSKAETFELIERLLDEGKTTAEIALALGVTQAYVFQVRQTMGAPKISKRPDPRQLPLFE